MFPDIEALRLRFNAAVTEYNAMREEYYDSRYPGWRQRGTKPGLRTKIASIELEDPNWPAGGGIWIIHWDGPYRSMRGITGDTLVVLCVLREAEIVSQRRIRERWRQESGR